MFIDYTDDDNVSIISRWILILLIILTAFEVIFFPQAENIYGCFTFFIAWIILSKFVMNQEDINYSFLPFISLFGVGICFYFLPLLMTLVEGKPLTFRFATPYLTFTLQLINLVVLVAAYRICLLLNDYDNNILTKLWDRIGYFTPPTDLQIWIMGFIGIGCQVFLLLIMGSDDAEAENLGFIGHLTGVVKWFSCFPVLLLFRNLFDDEEDYDDEVEDGNRNTRIYVFIYLILLIVLGAATGKRTSIFSSFVTIALCYVLPVFTENKKIFTSKTVAYSLISIYLITGPVADLAAAMALGRDNSGQTGFMKTLENVSDLYQDKEKLHVMYQAFLTVTDNGGDNLSGWSEYYVDNIMLDRFCNLRVCDMSIDYAEKLGFDNPTMHEYMWNQVLFLLPTPVLNAFGVHTNKFELQYTPGDLMSMDGLNLSYYHGYRVAGDVGIGMYLWGYMYFVYAFFIFIAFFYYLSSLTKLSDIGMLIIPVPILINVFRYFLQFNNATGIVGVVSTLLRTGWQDILVYCIIFFIIRKIIN